MPDSTTSPRRFPPPWTVEDKDAYFIVRDHNGQDLGRLRRRHCRTFLAVSFTVAFFAIMLDTRGGDHKCLSRRAPRSG
jgi:hypothetical protein